MMYIKIDFLKKKFTPSYDQFIKQYPLFILNEWSGHCV